MKTIDNVKYYDAQDISEKLGISIVTVREYFKSGKIPALKIAKSWYVNEYDLSNFLNKTT